MSRLRNIGRFYYDGFREMGPLGRTLWWVIGIKLVLMFAVLRIFFFPNALGGMEEREQAEKVSNELINR